MDLGDVDRLKAAIRDAEGLSLKPRADSGGTIQIGYGHNLTFNGIGRDVAERLLDGDISGVFVDLDAHLPWWKRLDGCRQRALAELCYNVGVVKLLRFPNFLADLSAGRYADAANELVNSAWHEQVGRRAPRIIGMVRDGVDG